MFPSFSYSTFFLTVFEQNYPIPLKSERMFFGWQDDHVVKAEVWEKKNFMFLS